MNADRIKAEIFETHYNDIKKHVKSRNFAAARKSTILASKTMYEMARESHGELREHRLRQADSLYKQIASLDKLIAEEKKRGTSSQSQSGNKRPSPEQQVMRGGQSSRSGNNNNDDDEQRIYESMPVPDISFDDVVGLHEVKKAVREKIIEPRKHPELYDKYKIERGGGILMYGPPGTGKTMIAKAIAHEAEAEFFSLRCSDLVSRYFGGTEQNLGALFTAARSKKNALIFFDEFDAIAANRDKNNSTVMRRVVPELLTQLQGVNDDNNKNGSSLLIVAATNVPWMLDNAFMRPGRFDERIYVGLPDEDARRGIIERNLRGIPCREAIDYAFLVEHTNGFNCADIVQLVKKAKTFPLERERKGFKDEGLTMEDFARALETTRSSVMRSDIEKMMKWRETNGLL